MLEKINTLDFSRYSAKHKEQLWKRLNETRGRRVLREDELEVSAAGVCEDHKCTRCGSVNVDSQGKCGDCGRENL
jgi:hypothetical protein